MYGELSWWTFCLASFIKKTLKRRQQRDRIFDWSEMSTWHFKDGMWWLVRRTIQGIHEMDYRSALQWRKLNIKNEIWWLAIRAKNRWSCFLKDKFIQATTTCSSDNLMQNIESRKRENPPPALWSYHGQWLFVQWSNQFNLTYKNKNSAFERSNLFTHV